MSCWRKCNAQIKNADLSILKEAAKKVGLTVNENVKKVGTSYGYSERNNAFVDGAFVHEGRQVQIGYRLKGDNDCLEIVGDFWNTPWDSEAFVGTLGQVYREIQIQQQAELMGYTVEEVTTNTEGDTVITCYAWA